MLEALRSRTARVDRAVLTCPRPGAQGRRGAADANRSGRALRKAANARGSASTSSCTCRASLRDAQAVARRGRSLDPDAGSPQPRVARRSEHSCVPSRARGGASEAWRGRSTVCRHRGRGAELCLRRTKGASSPFARKPRPCTASAEDGAGTGGRGPSPTRPRREELGRADLPICRHGTAHGRRRHEVSTARLRRRQSSAQRTTKPASCNRAHAKPSERSEPLSSATRVTQRAGRRSAGRACG
jgi:hypothetical protein